MICLALAAGVDPDQYPRGELLVEPAALAKANAGDQVILDVRSAAAYRAGHIPGAISVEAATLSKAFSTDEDPESWARRLGQLGMDAKKDIVVYGDDWREAARIWFILRYWGVENAKLLNGGWAAWKAADGKISNEVTKPTPLAASAHRSVGRVATKGQVQAAVNDKSAQIWDARSTGEFQGQTGGAKRKGCIPGAIHLEWSDLIDAKTQKVKPAAELSKLLKDSGIDPSKPVVTYCQSGGRASVAAFVMELMGGTQVRNYYRSWAEWGSADDTPVQKPEKK
jgi:thiosulfate/3-mercaptopyruvate sulfurtransferase